MGRRMRGACGLVMGLYLLLAAGGPLAAQAGGAGGDVDGAKDHPLISRFAGSTIIGYAHRDWDATTFPVSNRTDPRETTTLADPRTVEGTITRIVYLAPVGKSPLEVFRNYQQAVAAAGFKTVFSCDMNCGQIFFHWRFGAVRNGTTYTKTLIHPADNPNTGWNAADALSADDGRGIYATLTHGGRTVHLFFYTSVAAFRPSNAAATVVEIAEPKAMQTGEVTVDADAMFKSLTTDGSVALYGLLFDTDKAEIKAESKPQLDQMAKLLQAHADISVFIVGHTDNTGAFEHNQDLSKRRADAVKDALVTEYQIAAARLGSYGVANLAPVASNADSAGRARNRRVELVLR